jgi:hypothetical protein
VEKERKKTMSKKEAKKELLTVGEILEGENPVDYVLDKNVIFIYQSLRKKDVDELTKEESEFLQKYYNANTRESLDTRFFDSVQELTKNDKRITVAELSSKGSERKVSVIDGKDVIKGILCRKKEKLVLYINGSKSVEQRERIRNLWKNTRFSEFCDNEKTYNHSAEKRVEIIIKGVNTLDSNKSTVDEIVRVFKQVNSLVKQDNDAQSKEA